MNLHEECLLKYLLNPVNLMNTTELLKLNNIMIEKQLTNTSFTANSAKLNYNSGRV